MNVIANQNPHSTVATAYKVSFKGIAYSNTENQYQKTYLSKVIGAASGFLIGGLMSLNRVRKFGNRSGDFYKSVVENHSEWYTDKMVKACKSFKMKSAAFLCGGMIPALLGLGAGAVVDYFVNKNRANQAGNKEVVASKNNIVA